MTIARCFCLTWLASLTCSALAVEPGANYQHLKHLEQVIGHWKYVGKDEEGNTVHGSETNCWIHNKNYVRVQGLWEPDGSEPVSYELIIGWDAELKQEVMHGMLSTGSTFHRHGNYDKKLNATVSNQVSVAPDGTKNASVCTLAYGKDKNSWSAKWTEATRDGEPVKVAQIKAKRVVEDMTLPKNAKEEFEHMVGIWKLTGQASKGALEGTWCLKWCRGSIVWSATTVCQWRAKVFDLPISMPGTRLPRSSYSVQPIRAATSRCLGPRS